MFDGPTPSIVIPAKAAIQLVVYGRKMDPRFGGDDGTLGGSPH
jgi:hypothetical protein